MLALPHICCQHQYLSDKDQHKLSCLQESCDDTTNCDEPVGCHPAFNTSSRTCRITHHLIVVVGKSKRVDRFKATVHVKNLVLMC